LYSLPCPLVKGECTKEEYQCQNNTNRFVRWPFPFSLPASALACEVARNPVEGDRRSQLIGYATATPLAIDFVESALAIEASSNGIWRYA